jgi:hypothetical protein
MTFLARLLTGRRRLTRSARQYLFATNSVWAGNFVRISVP